MPTTLYEKVLAVFGMLRNSIDQKTGKIDLAPLFNASVGYPVDSLVVYENVLYRCIIAHQGDWNTADFATATIQDVLDLKAKKTDLAPEYSEETMYLKYQLVIKDGEFVQCIIPGVGSNAVFQRITVASLIARIEQGVTQEVTLDAIYAAVQNIAPAYETWKDYKVKNICTYKGVLYECKENVYSEIDEPDEAWWNRYWKRTTVDAVLKSQYVYNGGDATLNTLVLNSEYSKLEITADTIKTTPLTSEGQERRINLNVSKSGTISLLQDLAPNYEDLTKDGEVEFKAGRIVTFRGVLYLCIETHTSQLWKSEKWTECTIDAVIDELIVALADVRADVASLEERQVLVDGNGTGVGVSTMGLLSDYTGMDFVRRIFFVPSQMYAQDLIGLSVLNGTLSLNNGAYTFVWFKPIIFGCESAITSVSFFTRSGSASGGSVYARLWMYNESERVFLGCSTNSADWSAATESVIRYEFDSITVSYPNAYFGIDFSATNEQNSARVGVGMRVTTQGGRSNMLYAGNNETPEEGHVAPYNMKVNDVGLDTNDLYYIHICECAEGFTTANIGPNVSGEVVAVMAPDQNQTWPSMDSATSCRYVLSEAFHFENPDRVHFIAFDTEPHTVGLGFSAGKSLPIGLVSYGTSEYTCPTDNFVLQTDNHACPRISFIRAITPRKLTYYNDSADFSNARYIKLPKTESGEVEYRILIYGCGENSTLNVFSGNDTGLLAFIGENSSWMNYNNGMYSITIGAYTTIMLVFKSFGTIVRPLPGTSFLAPQDLWSVERQVLN